MASNHFSNYEGIYNIVHQPALIVAGCSVLVALVLSLFLIFQHLRSYTNPSVHHFSNSYVVFDFFFVCLLYDVNCRLVLLRFVIEIVYNEVSVIKCTVFTSNLGYFMIII